MDLHNIYIDRLANHLRPPTLVERITGKRQKPPPRPGMEELEGISAEVAR
jgi:hypothetical protein